MEGYKAKITVKLAIGQKVGPGISRTMDFIDASIPNFRKSCNIGDDLLRLLAGGVV